MAALSRAFTSRRNRISDGSPNTANATTTPTRSASARIQSRRAVRRSQISGPMELLSTTNMLAFNAPDIRPTLSPQFSTTSGEDESDHTLHTTGLNSPPTSVEASPVDSRCGSPEPNHLSTYFQVSRPSSNDVAFSGRGSGARRGALGGSSSSPAIPQRAPSHTKAAHKAIARQNSQSSSRSPTSSLKAPPNSMPSARDTTSTSSPHHHHPFGRELAQLDEVAEGFGVRDEVSAEEELMRQRGLTKFGVQDYLWEVECLYNTVFVAENDQVSTVTPAWI